METQQSLILASLIGTWFLALVTLVLRFVCRRLSIAKIWWDDWIMLLPMVLSTALIGMEIWSVTQGLGKHTQSIPEEQRARAVMIVLKCQFVLNIGYSSAITFVKLSILAMYWRLFRDAIGRLIIALAIILTAWWISVVFVTIFSSNPIAGSWDIHIPLVSSIDRCAFIKSTTAINIVTDMALILLPIKPIWTLKLKTYQKVLLCSNFFLGGFIAAVAIGRLVIMVNSGETFDDMTWDLSAITIWTIVELNIGIVCGCLPLLKPLINYVVTGSTDRSHFSGSTDTLRHTSFTTVSTPYPKSPAPNIHDSAIFSPQSTHASPTPLHARAQSWTECYSDRPPPSRRASLIFRVPSPSPSITLSPPFERAAADDRRLTRSPPPPSRRNPFSTPLRGSPHSWFHDINESKEDVSNQV